MKSEVYNCIKIDSTVITITDQKTVRLLKKGVEKMNEKKISVNFGMIRRDVLRHWPIWVLASVWYLLFVFMVNTTSRYSISLINIGNKISENIMISLTENTAFLAYFLGFAAAIASSAAAICFLFIAFYFVRLWARLMSLFCAGVPAFRIC